ncbi:hypothetical protein [Comamonas sp. JC664]|uniref:hypothetical protein n=1 Tax=Comamonas sp. JC664 TaxID=2801917 RepID=UPI00174BCF09|nr:hypothetical protein [Comamonas sp. JC664]MBL0695915.1 hypothetical protein [Comamonas sp. JC664]GHG64202.1 hypothetical protein GCM10012319_04450 [Comamonas sp. KCTC 72670]
MSAPSTSVRRGLVFLAIILGCALAVVAMLRNAASVQEVVFVNGLDFTVQVSAGSERFPLKRNEHRVRAFPEGALDITVTRDGVPLAQDMVLLPEGGGHFVYNVLGAAPLYVSNVVYSRNANAAPEPEPRPLLGTPFERVSRVDFVLTEPPSRISMSKNSRGAVTRVRLGRIDGDWVTRFNWLMTSGHTAEAHRLADTLARALPDMKEAKELALFSRMSLDDGEGSHAVVATARDWRDANPDSLDAHRLWAYQMRRAGRLDEVRAHYTAELASHPDSVLMAILLARTEPGREALARVEALYRAHPDDLRVRRALAMFYVREQQWAEALPLFTALASDDPEYMERYADAHDEVLVGLGRREEAEKRAAERLPPFDAKTPTPWNELLQLARFRGKLALTGANSPLKQYVSHVAVEDKVIGALLRTWLAASMGEHVSGDDLRMVPAELPRRSAAVILAALQEGPEAAAGPIASADTRAFHFMGSEVGILLAAEFERLGDSALAARTLDVSRAELGFAELQDVVRGTRDVDSLVSLRGEERAALLLVVARRQDAQGVRSTETYARVKKLAPLPGAVTIALSKWPRPKPVGAVAGAPVP